MWTFDLIIKNAIVATAADEFPSEIGIKDGKIVLLAPEIPVNGNCEVIDAEGGYVTVCSVSLPGESRQAHSDALRSQEVSTRTFTSLSLQQSPWEPNPQMTGLQLRDPL